MLFSEKGRRGVESGDEGWVKIYTSLCQVCNYPAHSQSFLLKSSRTPPTFLQDSQHVHWVVLFLGITEWGNAERDMAPRVLHLGPLTNSQLLSSSGQPSFPCADWLKAPLQMFPQHYVHLSPRASSAEITCWLVSLSKQSLRGLRFCFHAISLACTTVLCVNNKHIFN